MSLFDPRLDHIEHYGAKGMQWGVVKKKEKTESQQREATNKRRLELRRKAALLAKEAKEKGTEALSETDVSAAGGSGGSGGSGESETDEEDKDEEDKDEKKGKAKAPKAPVEKPKKEDEKLNKEQKIGKKMNAEAWKNRKKLAELEKELSVAKKIINDKELAERKSMVSKMLDSNISYASASSRTAASSGVLGFVLKKETG